MFLLGENDMAIHNRVEKALQVPQALFNVFFVLIGEIDVTGGY
jgi:hypothetical protein